MTFVPTPYASGRAEITVETAGGSSGAAARPSVSYRPDIEGLRAIAILLVVSFHAALPACRGGFIGVDVFFVLSGYLITNLLLREMRQDGRIDFLGFYARRARRLLPASFLVLLTTLVSGYFVFSPLEMARFSQAALATFGYVSNLFFLRNAADYFSPTVDGNPFLHTWSLAVEEQFYLLWPLVVLFGFRGNAPRKRLMYTLIIVSFTSFLGCAFLTRTHQPWAFYATPCRAWEFSAGGMAAFLPHSRTWDRLRRPWLAWLGLIGLAATSVVFSVNTTFPGFAAIAPVLTTVAILIAGEAHKRQGLTTLLEAKPFQTIGRLSYSWYLWHWPALVLARTIWPKLSIIEEIFVLAGALAVAALTHVTVENPVRFSKYLSQRPVASLAAAACVTVVGLTITLAMQRKISQDISRSVQAAYLKAQADIAQLPKSCMVGFGKDRPVECALGRKESLTKVIVFGDSHAEQWLPALDKIAETRNWRLITLLKSACPVARVPIFNPHLKREETECSTWRERALQRIVEMHPYAVFLSNSDGYVKRDQPQDGYATLFAGQWVAGLRSTLSYLSESHISTFLMRDTPRPDIDVPICLSRVASGRPWFATEECAVSPQSALNEPLWRAEESAARGLPNVFTLDLSDQFCSRESCEPVRAGVVVYRDGNHMTSNFSSTLAPALWSRLSGFI